MDKEINHHNPSVYRIHLQECLDSDWKQWFDGFAITEEAGGGSLLTGPVVDQAALHALLRKLRDLGLTLLSLKRVETQAEKGDVS